eukprot:1160773-Pelagomonas_calceolata.AAC.1
MSTPETAIIQFYQTKPFVVPLRRSESYKTPQWHSHNQTQLHTAKSSSDDLLQAARSTRSLKQQWPPSAGSSLMCRQGVWERGGLFEQAARSCESSPGARGASAGPVARSVLAVRASMRAAAGVRHFLAARVSALAVQG